MAIDKNRTKELIESINDFFESISGGLQPEAVAFLKTTIMGPAFEEIYKLVNESRPPILFLVGRSGHGKSSVINALADKPVSEVGDVKPTTPESVPYMITFEDRFSAWQVIDSRGIFETTTPEGAADKNAVELLIEDVKKYKPDVIMHVISAPEIRNLSQDLKLFALIQEELKKEIGAVTPAVIVLNKADTLGNPREWPPAEHAKKAALLHEALEYMTKDVFKVPKSDMDLNYPYRGCLIDSENYLGVIPVCALGAGDNWNIDILSDFIGMQLPESALLNFYQAQRRKEQLRKVSSAIIKRFAVIASGIGASPIPLSDFVVLTPLQLLMLAVIGGLSCRPISKDTAYEYLSAAGINVLAATGVRYISQQLIKLVPFAGWAASSSLAGSSTFALGKAAEAYFFQGEIQKPEKFKLEWDEIKKIEETIR